MTLNIPLDFVSIFCCILRDRWARLIQPLISFAIRFNVLSLDAAAGLGLQRFFGRVGDMGRGGR
jgi:hypothetical protein